MRLIIGITGATGVIYGVRLLERLREASVETHLVISRWGARTLLHETPYSREQVEALAHAVYAPNDMGAAIYFLGVVRDEEGGKTISAIEYEAFQKMVEHQFELLFDEVEKRWPIEVARSKTSEAHRRGTTFLGRPSVRSPTYAAIAEAVGKKRTFGIQ